MGYMSSEQQESPYKALGQRLKAVRQKLQESLPEVCGAVEIDAKHLERIEQGAERPSEDILQLLINHFGMQDDEAEGLWRLAGYDHVCDHVRDFEEVLQQGRGAMMVMAVDPRIIYSDHIQINANKNGVVLNFAQKANMPQPLVTARVGMSREQAYAVMRTLQEALHRSEPGQLPAPKPKQQKPSADKKPPKQDQQ